jgi:hypothetical protein
MWQWRRVCGWCFWITIAGLIWSFPLAIGAAGVSIFAGVLTLIYMGRAAEAEAGAGYAARQVTLAAILSIICLMGVWLVPLLVESDLLKWRALEERGRTDGSEEHEDRR